MLIRIDPAREEPLFAQLAGSIRSDIAAGDLRSGDRLPSAREVAAGLDVNLHTVLRAYQALREEGLVAMHRGRGAVVTDAAASLVALRDDIASLVDRAHALGLSADTLASLMKEHR